MLSLVRLLAVQEQFFEAAERHGSRLARLECETHLREFLRHSHCQRNARGDRAQERFHRRPVFQRSITRPD